MSDLLKRDRLAENPVLDLRFRRTLTFLSEKLPPPATILDLGSRNSFSEIMEECGYTVRNTPDGVDLDLYPETVRSVDADAVTAFEILEHLVAPFNVLREIRAPRLLVTVPLRLWFDTAFRNDDDPWDRHFHEFEDWQFDWLLEKAGWRIRSSEKWNGPAKRIGVRPLLRLITPRFYALDAERTQRFSDRARL